MEEVVNKIVSNFDGITKVEKINVGFTNTLYSLDDKYILKLCTNKNNEEKFKKEIAFYLENRDNSEIPNLVAYSTNSEDCGYCYEIMERVEGVTLYNVWHTFKGDERKNIIKQLCDLMKSIHANEKESYDWSYFIDKQISDCLIEAQKINYFTVEELSIINDARTLYPKYLKSDKFVYIHNDLHFDNILYHNGNIKLIDFERSMIAPFDFELDILYRMIRFPWKYASEETEQYTKLKDYENIPSYIKEYYPELFEVEFLDKRIAIYDCLDALRACYKYPDEKELKEIILKSSKDILN